MAETPCSRGQSNIVVSRHRPRRTSCAGIGVVSEGRNSSCGRCAECAFMFTGPARGERSQLFRSGGEFAGTGRRESAQVVGVGGVERHGQSKRTAAERERARNGTHRTSSRVPGSSSPPIETDGYPRSRPNRFSPRCPTARRFSSRHDRARISTAGKLCFGCGCRTTPALGKHDPRAPAGVSGDFRYSYDATGR